MGEGYTPGVDERRLNLSLSSQKSNARVMTNATNIREIPAVKSRIVFIVKRIRKLLILR